MVICQDCGQPTFTVAEVWGLTRCGIWQCWLFESRILKVGDQISGERLDLLKTWCWDNLLTAIWKEWEKARSLPHTKANERFRCKDWNLKRLKKLKASKLSLLPLMWKPYKGGIHRTEGYKLLFNLQMPPTSCILGRGTLECFELLQEALRGFLSSVSQTCNVHKSFTFFSQDPDALWTSFSTFGSTHHRFCSLISEPTLLLSPA